jgi:hypothetical protein
MEREWGGGVGVSYLLVTLFANRKVVPNSEVPLVLAKSFPRALEMAEMTSALVIVEKANLSVSVKREREHGMREGGARRKGRGSNQLRGSVESSRLTWREGCSRIGSAGWV